MVVESFSNSFIDCGLYREFNEYVKIGDGVDLVAY